METENQILAFDYDELLRRMHKLCALAIIHQAIPVDEADMRQLLALVEKYRNPNPVAPTQPPGPARGASEALLLKLADAIFANFATTQEEMVGWIDAHAAAAVASARDQWNAQNLENEKAFLANASAVAELERLKGYLAGSPSAHVEDCFKLAEELGFGVSSKPPIECVREFIAAAIRERDEWKEMAERLDKKCIDEQRDHVKTCGYHDATKAQLTAEQQAHEKLKKLPLLWELRKAEERTELAEQARAEEVKLSEALRAYVNYLHRSNTMTSGFLYAHNWKYPSELIEEGNRLRECIADAEAQRAARAGAGVGGRIEGK